MAKSKYTWTDDEAPTNTGSVTRKARFNLRMDCSTRARTHRIFTSIREITGMDRRTDKKSYADVWEEKALLALEHIVRRVRHGSKADKAYFLALFDRLPPEDYERAQYERLKERFGGHHGKGHSRR